MIDLRTLAYLEVLQPQFAAYMASTAKGFIPIKGMASLWIEIAPGIAISEITNIVVKATQVRPGLEVVERAFGLLEVHSMDHGELLQAGQEILQYLSLEEESRLKPRIVSEDIITQVNPYHCMLINRMRKGQMLVEGDTLYCLEVHPAGYAALLANEAEKNAKINLVDVTYFGAFGRLYLSGTDSDIARGVEACRSALAKISGRENLA
ncbi:MAG: hypothetical protein AABZ60_09870 [Planctomycetota bacterium]